MRVNYKRPFSQFVKKAHKPLQLAIEDVVEVICEDPHIGEAKVGDLAGIRSINFDSTDNNIWSLIGRWPRRNTSTMTVWSF